MKKNNKRESIIIAVILLVVLAVAFYLDAKLPSYHIAIKVIKKAAVYSLVAVSMNLLNGFTGLFSLGQAGFMLLGAYAYAVLSIPVDKRAGVYQYFNGGIVKSDYLAIATLGFAEIVRAFFQWNALGPLTNGSNLLKSYPDLGGASSYLILIGLFIAIILLLVNSTYGRAFKAIRDDEIAAEAMGINLAHHKRLAFIISSFFAGVGGGMLAMYMGTVQALSFKSTMTYEILLIVVIGGIGSITGSVITSFLYIASLEWLLRGLDSGEFLGIQAPGLFKNGFRMAVVSVIIMCVVLFFRKGIMGDRELSDLLKRKKNTSKGGARNG